MGVYYITLPLWVDIFGGWGAWARSSRAWGFYGIFPFSGAEVEEPERDCKSCHPSVIFFYLHVNAHRGRDGTGWDIKSQVGWRI